MQKQGKHQACTDTVNVQLFCKLLEKVPHLVPGGEHRGDRGRVKPVYKLLRALSQRSHLGRACKVLNHQIACITQSLAVVLSLLQASHHGAAFICYITDRCNSWEVM